MSPYAYADSASRRLHRKALASVCLCLGAVFGFVLGVTVSCVMNGQKAEDSEWKTGRIVCAGEWHEGARHTFALENRTKSDYVATEKSYWHIFGKTATGLEPARAAAFSTPVFLPRGERVHLTIECTRYSRFVIYDLAHRYRIECGR